MYVNLPAGYVIGTYDIDTLARTIWAEARGEGRAGMVAVAHVILNRLNRPGWWSRDQNDGIPDDTIQAVCCDPWQFSCWNQDDPNRAKLLAVGPENKTFATAADVAVAVITPGHPDAVDPTGGATHYHTTAIGPPWASGHEPCARIGRHVFYRNIK